jgi:hypothetical protein
MTTPFKLKNHHLTAERIVIAPVFAPPLPRNLTPCN